MLKFLLFIILFIVFIGFLLGFSILRGLKRLLFGPGPSARQQHAGSRNNYQHQRQQTRAQAERKDEEPQVKISRKLFEAEKGEYVDYEEIKD